jgi:outer membrane protein with beta-barrel domain
MRRALKLLIITAAVGLVAAPMQARAEGFVTPWIGANWGSGLNIDNGRAAFGVNAGAMGAGIIGGEVAFGYSPSFWGNQNDFGNNSVIDLMGNLIVGIPIGGTHGAGVRPFVSGGIGLLRTQLDGGTLARVSSSNNMLGWNLGGGAMGFFNDHVGLRGDVRYTRGFENLNTGNTVIDLAGANQLHYWRLQAGVVLR